MKEGTDDVPDDFRRVHKYPSETFSVFHFKNSRNMPIKIEGSRKVFIPMIAYAIAVMKWRNSKAMNHSIGSFQYVFTCRYVNYFRTNIT